MSDSDTAATFTLSTHSHRWKWSVTIEGEQWAGWADSRREAEEAVAELERAAGFDIRFKGPRTPWGHFSD